MDLASRRFQRREQGGAAALHACLRFHPITVGLLAPVRATISFVPAPHDHAAAHPRSQSAA